MEPLMQSTISHLLVSTQEPCSIFEPNQLTHPKYAKLSGYYLWHWRFGNCPNESICITTWIPYSIGLNTLNSHRFDPHEKCPAYVMGKSHLNNMQKRNGSNSPLARVKMDGDHRRLYRTSRLYCLKTKDDILNAIKKWYSDIVELRFQQRRIHPNLRLPGATQ